MWQLSSQQRTIVRLQIGEVVTDNDDHKEDGRPRQWHHKREKLGLGQGRREWRRAEKEEEGKITYRVQQTTNQ